MLVDVLTPGSDLQSITNPPTKIQPVIDMTNWLLSEGRAGELESF